MYADKKNKDLVVRMGEKMKMPQLRNSSTQPKPAKRISLIEQVTVKCRETDIAWERVQVEQLLAREKSELRKLDKAIEEKLQHLEKLKGILEKNNDTSVQLLDTVEKKFVEAGRLFEKAKKSKGENISATEALTKDLKALKSEIAMLQGTLTENRRYSNLLFTLSPPEWQEDLKAKGQSDGDAQDEQNKEPQESAMKQGLKFSPGRVLPSTKEPTLSSANSETLFKISKLENNKSEHVVRDPEAKSKIPLQHWEKLEFCFSDPQQLLEVVKELTEQNLSLIEHSTRADRTVEMLRQATKITSEKNEEEYEKLTSQVNDMKDRLETEKERVATLQRKVQLHDAIKTKDQDVLLDALGQKVTQVYSSCVDSRLLNLSTLEKLSSIEYRNYLLLEQIEDIPEEDLKKLQQIKEIKRQGRLRAKQLILEGIKRREMIERCKERSLSDAKKKSGRKLMPRCIPVERKIKVPEDDNTAEDELQAYLFSTEKVQ